jgi:hypothetical protein
MASAMAAPIAQGADAPAAKAPTLVPFFAPASAQPKATDVDGFLQRWLLLEPVEKPNRTNTVFTGSYVRQAFGTPPSPALSSPYHAMGKR